MPAYVIAEIRVTDFEVYKQYIELVPALIRKHGGEYVVRGGAPETLEGEWTPQRVVVLKFPNRNAARAFFDDHEYGPVRDIRRASSASEIVLVDGVGEPGDAT